MSLCYWCVLDFDFVLCKQVDDMRGFRDLLRMSVEDFNYLLERVSPAIIKKDTHLRKAISPRERLSVTLRFLATGKCVDMKIL